MTKRGMIEPKYKVMTLNCQQCGKLVFVRYDNKVTNSSGAINCPECDYKVFTWSSGEGHFFIELERTKKTGVEIERYLSTLAKCPKCNALLNEKVGKYGKFWGCSNYPECTFTFKK